jgi:hypothetical protein
VDQPRDAGIDRGHHRGAAHGVHVDLHADSPGFLHDCLEHFDLCLRRSRLWRETDLAGVPDALGSQRLHCRARFSRRLAKTDLS